MIVQDVKNEIIQAILSRGRDLVETTLPCGLELYCDMDVTEIEYDHCGSDYWTPASCGVSVKHEINVLQLCLNNELIWEADAAETKEFENNLNS
jgi:hypothetical protein